MTEEPLIRVQNVSKRFARSLRASMVYGLADILRTTLVPRPYRSFGYEARLRDMERFPRTAVPLPRLRPTEFWALQNVSFSVRRGECVGVVGANGAGKSTLFSLLSGIYAPTVGRIEIRGRLQALIALGAGFHPMLTGRENIFVNASVLGLRDAEIRARLDDIIAFAELGEFIDAPVRSYSSGMLVRLGFAVAAHLDPDILLIDEVLAVGDSRFQAKCQAHTRKLRASGKAIMVVSHYMQNIQGMCTSAIWLDRGRLVRYGDVYEVTEAYQRHLFQSGALADRATKEATGGFSACIERIEITDIAGNEIHAIDASQPFRVSVVISSASEFPCGRVYISCSLAAENQPLFAANMLEDGGGVPIRVGQNRISAEFAPISLAKGPVRFYACVRNEDGVVAISNGLLSRVIDICHSSHYRNTGLLPRYPRVAGIIEPVWAVPYRWMIETSENEGSVP